MPAAVSVHIMIMIRSNRSRSEEGAAVCHARYAEPRVTVTSAQNEFKPRTRAATNPHPHLDKHAHALKPKGRRHVVSLGTGGAFIGNA